MDPLVVELHVEESTDFFRVSNAIEQIESSEHKDIEKIKILFKELKKTTVELGIDTDIRIKGLKWDNKKYIIKEMTEQELLKEIEGCEERYNGEESRRNLISLSRRYKQLYSNAKVYPVLVNYTIKLLDRVIGNPRIAEIYDDTSRAQALADDLCKVEEENIKLKDQLADLNSKLEFIKVDLRESILNVELFKILSRAMRENMADDKLVRILVMVQLQKTITLKDLFKESRIAPGEIKQILGNYPQYFKIDREGKISLNTESMLPEAEKEAQIKVKEIDEIDRINHGVMNRIKTILNNIKNLKK